MLDPIYYKQRYTTSESRVLYLVAKKNYGSLTKMAEEVGFSKQNANEMITQIIPLKWAAYFGRIYSFHPGLMRFGDYILLGGDRAYSQLLQSTHHFNSLDKQYILGGQHIQNVKQFIRDCNKNILK